MATALEASTPSPVLTGESTPSKCSSSTASTTASTMAIATPTAAPPWMPSTGLLDMPNEVLRQIVLDIDGKFSKTLWSLCLTCKHLRAIVEEYCEPDYNIRGKIIKDPFLLMDRLLVQPHLRQDIRVVRMEFDYARNVRHTEEEAQTLLCSIGLKPLQAALWNECGHGSTRDDGGPVWLAALLPRIEVIEISTTIPGQCKDCELLIELLNGGDLLPSHDFRHLHTLVLRYPPCFRESIWDYPSPDLYMLDLPQLRTVILDNVIIYQGMYPDPEFAGTSLVEELCIQTIPDSLMDFDFPHEWKIFRGLRKLHLHVERLHEGIHNIPQYILCLESQADSLEDLHLYSNEQYCQRDGTLTEISTYCPHQPSLKHYKKLKSLALTDMSLVGMSRFGPSHWHQSYEEILDHIAGMLPSTLEVFTHLVWDGPSRFALDIPLKKQVLHSWENVWKAANKDKFPNLKTVMVQKYGLDGVADGSRVIWRQET